MLSKDENVSEAVIDQIMHEALTEDNANSSQSILVSNPESPMSSPTPTESSLSVKEVFYFITQNI